MNPPFALEDSPLGRVVVAENTPPGSMLFYTTVDFEGRLDPGSVDRIEGWIAGRGGIRAALATCQQVHGDTAATVPPTHGVWREYSSCDALWSAARGVALGIKVADCLPVSLIDPEAAVSLNIHSGWRGTVRRIVGKTIANVKDVTPFDTARTSAWLGPTIRQCCFEVGPEVVGAFEDAFGDVSAFVDRAGAKPHVDVAGLTAKLLREEGVDPARIFDSGLCTRCDGSIFHSYRRSGPHAGRNLAIVAQ